MRVKINFPKPGVGIEEGTVLRWLRVVGDVVMRGEVLLEIETAKALQEMESPVSGVLIEFLAPDGKAIAVNSLLGVIETNE